MRIVAPRSLPGRSALGITLMQCMHFTQLRVVDAERRAVPAHAVGRAVVADVLLDVQLAARGVGLDLAWSIWMSSRQVPMNDMSERAIEATQSLGQPANFILNL